MKMSAKSENELKINRIEKFENLTKKRPKKLLIEYDSFECMIHEFQISCNFNKTAKKIRTTKTVRAAAPKRAPKWRSIKITIA